MSNVLLGVILKCTTCNRYTTPEEAHLRVFKTGFCACGGAFMVVSVETSACTCGQCDEDDCPSEAL